MADTLTLTLTAAECRALYDLIDMLSGGNANGVFGEEMPGGLDDDTSRACAKVFAAAGRRVPDWVEAELEELSWLELGRRARARLWDEDADEVDPRFLAVVRLFSVERSSLTVSMSEGMVSLNYQDQEITFPIGEVNAT